VRLILDYFSSEWDVTAYNLLDRYPSLNYTRSSSYEDRNLD